jgi:hypothetical protein
MKKHLKSAAIFGLVLIGLTSSVRHLVAADDEYSFKVHNTTKEKITKLLASEDGKEYGFFDVGDGIEPGKTVKLNWNKSTNDSGCKWFFKAEFDGGDESKPVKFDFCEDDLELEF